MDLRLPPGVPLVWRSPTELQLGGVSTRAIIRSPSTGAERFLESLRTSGTLSQFHKRGERLGLSTTEIDELLDALEGLFEQAPVSPRKRSAERVGSGDEPRASGADGRPQLVLVRGAGAVDGDDLAEHISALGCGVRRSTAEYLPPKPAEIGLVVDCADYVVAPRRYSPLMADDVPHVSVVADEHGASVGAFVVPGRTPCLRCDDLYRLDQDHAWAAIATQLAVTARAPLARVTREIARSLVLNVVASWLAEGTASAVCGAGAWTVDALTSEVRQTHRLFHAECGCRALPGTARQVAPRRGVRQTARASAGGASARA